ncbi:bifunctional diguanylate cyclase/phosphodiesterase [Paraglaciecola sp. L3A3]|uniref:putative bifunctional diguanylate cyclase/phosphodiesterase n=1 Tax=Paraglaciecola sp. L3A3 TaxID=2686358 RepID=UPI001E571560|nr:GGDEF domain-containing phosphodiesterase [Paraglaciecola sp. L3A3]
MSCLLLFRIVDLAEWKWRSQFIVSEGTSAINRFAFGVLLTAALWSMHTLIFLPAMDFDGFCFNFIILTAFAGGAVPVLSASRYISFSYGLILVFPLAIITLFSEHQYQQALGYIAIPLSILLITLGIKTSRSTANAIQQKYENEKLSLEMKQERNRVKMANNELKQASQKIAEINIHLEDEVKTRTAQIVNLNNLDPLTKLVNRKAFTTNLTSLIEKAKSNNAHLALLFIDLNGFKKINDTMGHKVGDSVLIQVAQRISAFSESNPVGRWGGDQFLVALSYSDEEAAKSIAKAIITSIEQIIFVDGNELHLTASIGIATSPTHTSSATELIQLADLTMCQQKKTSVAAARLFSVDLKEKIEASQRILDGLQHAIQRKQLYLCYQPIVSANDKSPRAFEALLRWDFNGTFIGPDQFIPLAEKSGLIKEIGAWVLNRACMDAKHWQYCTDTAVSVNVSVIQLMDDGFMRLLDNCLKSTGLPPHRLHLEITESTFVENQNKVLQQLKHIQERQINLSIDDFGTGYSSLSQLQTLPVNYVKIDKTFVDNIEGKGEAIIRATQYIAQALNYKTIAEGVETDKQADLLFAMGIDYLQGYNFAKPMKTEDLILWQKSAPKSTSSTKFPNEYI